MAKFRRIKLECIFSFQIQIKGLRGKSEINILISNNIQTKDFLTNEFSRISEEFILFLFRV
jgi:hypothetical protein